MSTLAWVAIGLGAYAVFMAVVLSVLGAARRSDEATDRAVARAMPAWATGPPARARGRRARVEASSHWLAQRTADAQSAFDADRIAVVLRDDARTWVVEAAGGAEGLCGTVLRGESAAEARAAAASVLLAEEAGDWSRWSLAAAGIVVAGELVGVVVAATRRERGIAHHDQELLERFAGLVAGHVGTRAAGAGAS